MKNIVKTVSLLTIVSLIPAAFAATSRVGVTNKASARLPSIAGHILSGGTTTTTTTSTTASYYGAADCVEKYEDCLRADDVCGSNFEECTTNVLLHAQMPKCSNILYQCSAAGVQQLFGTSAITALSTVASDGYVKDDKGNNTTEVAEYMYPLKNSELNNLIAGAKEGNKLTKEQCVKRYTNCLQRDDVCGENFELCTSDREFKKQAVLCDSTFERCPTDAKRELFGSTEAAASLKPAANSENNYNRLRTLIEDGRAYAVGNAVKTCNKVVKNCFVNACSKNPFRCVEGVSIAQMNTADFLGTGTSAINTEDIDMTETQDATAVRKWLKGQCRDTIGSNKSCHMVYREKNNISESDLMNTEFQEEVFNLAYSDKTVRDAIQVQMQENIKVFDTNAKNACVETIKSCAMRSCGGGLGSVCYKQARYSTSSTTMPATFTNNLNNTTSTINMTATAINDNGVHINGDNTYGDIEAGCSAIVNADPNCQYAATASSQDGYTYNYTQNNTFSTLFPKGGSLAQDPIGAIGKLNALLATSYNDAAIEKMKKQCRTIALSCVESVCGEDYINCYRNRTDIVAGKGGSGTYDTTDSKLDKSMNKVGGVLDYNIVIGLCMNTVKSSSVCEEHLKVATAEWRNSQDDNSWGNANSVGESWLGANATTTNKVLIGCRASDQSKKIGGSPFKRLDCSKTADPVDNSCNGIAKNGCIYDEPVYQEQSEYVLENGAKTLFQDLLRDVEMQAQMLYNAKLTKEQNICRNNNNGGLMGSGDNGSTFMWVKLNGSNVPGNYPSQGLASNQFTASNDLYGSFCRAKITVQSDDKDIQNLLKDKQTAYFAVGDSFTCGSWISDADLRKISDTVGKRAVCQEGYGKWNSETGECDDKALSRKENIAYAWGTVAPTLAGLGIGLGLTETGLVKGLMNKSEGTKTQKENRDLCMSYADKAKSETDGTIKADYMKIAKEHCTSAGGTDCSSSSPVVLYNVCDNLSTRNSWTKNDTADTAARTLIPIATSLGAGALGVGITASVIKQKKENIKNEAAQKWMDEIGEHIQCYLGTDELGTYGDVVSIELD